MYILMSCRIPRGMRGLKSAINLFVYPGRPSHPSRDAWIEIDGVAEMVTYQPCRIPRGMRGLKFDVVKECIMNVYVASLAGCVD